MKSIGLLIASTTVFLAAAQAATISTTLTVTNATVAISASGFSVNGPATLTGGIGNGTFSASIPVTGISGQNVNAPFTITLSGGAGTITGTITLPVTILSGNTTSGSGSATVTGGTGSYSGATGSFTLSGSGSSSAAGIIASFGGPGTITTGGGGGSTGTPTPTITAVLDSASNTANVAQGSIFIVKGTNLCASGIKSFDVPRPTVTPDGVKVTFTPAAGGAGTDAILVYTYNQGGVVQLAGILPSAVAPGNYNVTVTNGSASAPFAAKVVASKFELYTQDSSGSGLASVQNYISQGVVDLNSFTTGTGKSTTISPAKPGQFLIAYGTGMGPLVGGDNTASPSYDFSTHGVNVQAVVGGVSIPVVYAGRAGYAGEDQINFQLPANIPTGCTVSFQVSVNGTLSNATFIAIAPDATSSACVQPGVTPAQLQTFDQGGTFTAGGFTITQISETIPEVSSAAIKLDSVAGVFTRFTGYQLAGLAQYQASITTSGACSVIHQVGSQSQVLVGGTGTHLDAGAVTLNGPSGSNITNMALKQDSSNFYSATIGEEGFPSGIPGLGGNGTIVGGTYSLAGAGGKDVGSFNTSLTLGAPLTITGGLPATVVRSAGLPLAWTGGNASDFVEIVGYAGTATGTGTNIVLDAYEFICTTTAGQGGFTVPASILTQLPAVAASSITSGTGASFLFVASGPAPVSFKPSGVDAAYFSSVLGIGSTPTYQ